MAATGKLIRRAAAFLCFIILSVFPGRGRAADLSKENCGFEYLRHCNIMALKTNRYTEGRPVIIFLPGTLESGSIADTVRWIRNYGLYDGYDADVIAAAFRSRPLKLQDWKGPAEDILEYLRDRHKASPFYVSVDAVSSGGYGGCYLARLLEENGITVRELNLADACVPKLVTADWIREIAAAGTRVNIWGCRGSGTMSAEARRLIEELDGTENVRGAVLDTPHGKVLHDAIYEHGAHDF